MLDAPALHPFGLAMLEIDATGVDLIPRLDKHVLVTVALASATNCCLV